MLAAELSGQKSVHNVLVRKGCIDVAVGIVGGVNLAMSLIYAGVTAAAAVERGWIPDWLPKSARTIHEFITSTRIKPCWHFRLRGLRAQLSRRPPVRRRQRARGPSRSEQMPLLQLQSRHEKLRSNTRHSRLIDLGSSSTDFGQQFVSWCRLRCALALSG
jgi:hypothetical protein